MLWTLFVVLLALWLIGFIGFHVLGFFVHILLIVAILCLIFAVMGMRKKTP